MFDACRSHTPSDDAEIARHEVSEDGVMWRDYDPARDEGRNLHTRIVFAPPPANN
jgi:hypothetical protein